MKLTQENIEEINTVLIKNHVHYIDLRIEIIDHLCSELENFEEPFESVFPTFFESKKEIVQSMKQSHLKTESTKGMKRLMQNIFSKHFLLLFLGINLLVFAGQHYFSKEWLLHNFDIIPIILPAPISAILLYNLLVSKNKSTDLISLVAITNLFLMSYIMGSIYLIRSLETWVWMPILAFYISLAIAYYYFYFESRKLHQKRYKLLWS
ncbi:hypothetical protein J2X31_002751 [Flavobacterium arsenatis]|uniref:Uncharacterized protein n=1 Tax=Flavobacterium arsenatis TaxID=1484332 RepID=A0ABU1TS68_9FLAO|nr:hypothetical protein [Flavobacterium arsenatis]MDR6968725.1 hypothetical protein [Flavobacterium arsenatis]